MSSRGDPNTFIAFLSYRHDDDAHDEGFAEQLAKKLEKEVRVQGGESIALQVFFDKRNILWGEKWTERVTNGLGEATFLIPLVTPLFLDSPQCRGEVLRFAELEEQRGRNDLILPLYYVQDRRVEPKEKPTSPNDAERVASIIGHHQWIDWRQLRGCDWQNSKVRQTLMHAVSDLRNSIERVEARPVARVPKSVNKREWMVDQHGRHHQSLSMVLEQCEAGDKIFLEPGTYDYPTLVVNKAVEIQGVGDKRKVVIRLNGTDGIEIRSTSCVIENVTLQHLASTDGVAVRFAKAGGSLINCNVSTMGTACVRIEPSSAPSLRGCLLTGGRYGVWIPGESQAKIEDCEIIKATTAGIVCSIGATPFVRGCRIHDNVRGVALHEGAGGIFEKNNLRGNSMGAWDVGTSFKAIRRDNTE